LISHEIFKGARHVVFIDVLFGSVLDLEQLHKLRFVVFFVNLVAPDQRVEQLQLNRLPLAAHAHVLDHKAQGGRGDVRIELLPRIPHLDLRHND